MVRHPLALCGASLAVLAAGATAAAFPGNVRGPPPPAAERAAPAVHGAGPPAAETARRVRPRARPRPARRAARAVRPLRRPLVANLSGPTGLIAPAATGADWADADGMGFANTGSSGGDRWANYVSLYGPAQTYVCAPSPLAQGGPVCARNPEAMEMLDAFNTEGLAVGGGRGGFGAGGECFGFSSTAILFSLGASDPAWSGRVLPAAQLTRRGGLSALTEQSTAAVVNRGRRRKATQQYLTLRDTVRERQLLQSSWTYQSWWEQWAAAYPNLDGPTLYSILAGPVAAGQSTGMAIFWTTADGVAEGHELVARGLTGDPSHFEISVYDPNYPLQGGPKIVVAGDQWSTEDDPDGLYPHSDRPQPLSRGGTSPTVVLLNQDQMTLRTPAAWWSGDRQGEPSPLIGQAETARPPGRVYLQAGAGHIVQVTDERGRRALAPDGGPNGSAASGIPGALVRVGVQAPTTVILPSGPRYTVSLAAGRSGAGQLSVWDGGGVSVVSARGRAGGGLVARVDGTAADVFATPSRGTRVGVGVVRRIGTGRFRSAEAAPALGPGLGQSRPAGPGAPRGVGVALDGSGGVRVSAEGGARGPEVRLGTLGRNLYARVVRIHTGPIGAGTAVSLRPDWGDLGTGAIPATRTDGGGAVTPATAGASVVRQGAIRTVIASAAGPRARWRVVLRHPAAVTVAVAVQRAGCCTTRRIFDGPSGSIPVPGGLRADDRITLSVTAQAPGNPFLVQTASRRLRPSR